MLNKCYVWKGNLQDGKKCLKFEIEACFRYSHVDTNDFAKPEEWVLRFYL